MVEAGLKEVASLATEVQTEDSTKAEVEVEAKATICVPTIIRPKNGTA